MISKKLFGTLSDGKKVFLYTLKSRSAEMTLMEYGATVVSLSVPDRTGRLADVVLGHDSLDEYERQRFFFGAIVGRYANRIANGRFLLEEREYRLACNNGNHHLHGGVKGFDKVVWKGEAVDHPSNPKVVLTYVSPDGEENYPGTVTLTVTYSLTEKNEMKVEYVGTTNMTTILNPTHHSYFNLTGDPSKTILDHELMIAADAITPVDNELIPTGEMMDVINTPFEFRHMKKIGKNINDDNVQLMYGRGYDHNWVLNRFDGSLRSVAFVCEPVSGRSMEVLTDQPGLQFYSGNFLDGTSLGKNGISYPFRSGFCLEAQYFPDSPNKPQWHSPVLKPGATYRQTTIYKFSILK